MDNLGTVALFLAEVFSSPRFLELVVEDVMTRFDETLTLVSMQDRLESRHAARPVALLAGLGAASLSVGYQIEGTNSDGFVHVGEVTSVEIVRPWCPDPPEIVAARKAEAEAAKARRAEMSPNRAQRRQMAKVILRSGRRI